MSLATARAAATSLGLPLWRYLGGDETPVLPLPMVNIISGGLHARQQLDFQDFLIVPVSAVSYAEALELSTAVYAATAEALARRGLSTLKADEGGFGPSLRGNEEALELLVEAVQGAGYEPGDDIALALDIAATHFFDPEAGLYRLPTEGLALDSRALDDLVDDLPPASLSSRSRIPLRRTIGKAGAS